MKYMWETLRAPGKEWKRIYKGLGLVEHLLKFGAPQCLQEIRDEAFKFRQMIEFNYLEDGTERGNGSNLHTVRDKAKYVSHLIADFQKLEVEREAAKKMAGRYVGISSNEFVSGGKPSNPPSYTPNYGPGYERASSAPSAQRPEPTTQYNEPTFSPPQYSEPNLFAPPQQRGGNTQIFEVQGSRQLGGEQQQKQVTNLFELPKAQPQELNLFEAPKPVPTSQPSQPSIPTSLFTMPAKPQTTPAPAALFTMPSAARPEPLPAPSFAMPQAKPDPPLAQSSLFVLPQSTAKAEPRQDTGIFSLQKTGLKAEQKPTAIFTMPSNPAKAAATPVQAPLLTAQPAAVSTQRPNSEAALDGLFTPTPATAAFPVQKPGFPATKQGYPQAGYSAYSPSSSPTSSFKIHHNMEGAPGPTITQLKTTPSIAVHSDPSKSEKAKKPVDLETFLVDLDNLKVESKEKTEQTHLHGFGEGI